MKEKKNYKILPVRLEEPAYRALRKIAYLNEESMASLIREMIEQKIQSTKKVLTNADIAI